MAAAAAVAAAAVAATVAAVAVAAAAAQQQCSSSNAWDATPKDPMDLYCTKHTELCSAAVASQVVLWVAKHPMGHRPFFQVATLHIVVGFFWFSCIIVMFYHFANVICFHVLPIRMHQFKIGQCGINLVHMNEECYLFICCWVQIGLKESCGYIHSVMMSSWCTPIWGSIQQSFSAPIIWPYISLIIFYICWDLWFPNKSTITMKASLQKSALL